MSVCPSAWYNSAAIGRIFIKIVIRLYFEKFVEKIRVSLKSDKNKWYFTLRPTYLYDISFNSFF